MSTINSNESRTPVSAALQLRVSTPNPYNVGRNNFNNNNAIIFGQILSLLIAILQRLVGQINPSTPTPTPAPTPTPTPTPSPNTVLPLTDKQWNNVRTLLGYQASSAVSTDVVDTNGDGKVSAGDTIQLYGGITGGSIGSTQLTEAGAAVVNSPVQVKNLPLTSTQLQNLNNLFNIDNTVVGPRIIDVDGNGSVNAGDVVAYGGSGLSANMNTRLLSASDSSAINAGFVVNNASTLAVNRARWNDNNGGENGRYAYTIQYNGFTAPDYRRPIKVLVENGQPSKMIYGDDGSAVPAERQASVKSINDLFDLVQNAYDNNAERVDVSYDTMYGYPTSIYIDRSSQIADEEAGYTVSGLTFLGPYDSSTLGF